MIAALCAAFPVKAAEHYEGDAYAPGNGRLLYRESHWRDQGAGVDTRIVLYRCPDGTAFARKRIRVVPNAQAPDFVLVDARYGYSEGVRSKGDAREVFVRANKTAAERVAPIRIQAETVIDAGFDAFVRTHWDALSGTRATPLSFVVPSRLAALDFNVRRIDGETIDGHAVRRFRLALASWYGGLLPHIDSSTTSARAACAAMKASAMCAISTRIISMCASNLLRRNVICPRVPRISPLRPRLR